MTLHFDMVIPEWVISKDFNNQSKEYSTNHMISPNYVALCIFHKSYGLSEEDNEL